MPRYAPLVTAATCLAAAATSATGQTADDVMSVRQGVYTDEQAQRGESMYEQACSQCHPSDYFNQRVLPSWVDAPVSMLFDVMSTTMPEDRPSSLNERSTASSPRPMRPIIQSSTCCGFAGTSAAGPGRGSSTPTRSMGTTTTAWQRPTFG